MKYEFTKSFEIETGGEVQKITHIEINEPSASCASEMGRLSAFVGRICKSSRDSAGTISAEAIEDAKKAKEESSEATTSKDIVMMIVASSVDPADAFAALKNLLKSTGAKLNGELPCTGGNYNDIPYSALSEILGAYIINFFDIFR